MKSTPKALTIAGSDSGAGAGIQADLKTFAALGVYGTSVITAITAQNTVKVSNIFELSTDPLAAQIDAVIARAIHEMSNRSRVGEFIEPVTLL
jgi:hydroxymethylpyrimidine/phosphomethylpyrimidine kinase